MANCVAGELELPEVDGVYELAMAPAAVAAPVA
jgi:hypothetical protein